MLLVRQFWVRFSDQVVPAAVQDHGANDISRRGAGVSTGRSKGALSHAHRSRSCQSMVPGTFSAPGGAKLRLRGLVLAKLLDLCTNQPFTMLQKLYPELQAADLLQLDAIPVKGAGVKIEF